MSIPECWLSRSHSRLPSRIACAALVHFVVIAPGPLAAEAVENRYDKTTLEAARPRTPCSFDHECDDRSVCTLDFCHEGLCVNSAQVGCVPCDPTAGCPPMDVVFIMDTSGSMGDEAAALCAEIDTLVQSLADRGIAVTPTLLGITQTPGGPFACLEGDVVSLLGGAVPGAAGACPFPDTLSSFESWGPAVAIVAERFAWTPGATRVIIPLSDEAPCNGDLPEGCNDPGDDRDSLANAATIAGNRAVIVSPVIGTRAAACTLTLAADLAAATGGVAFQTADPTTDLAEAVAGLLSSACDRTTGCDDLETCTVADACDLDGRCTGIPLAQMPCSSDSDCLGSPCDPSTGRCLCVEHPELCVETVQPGPDTGCIAFDEELTINVVVSRSSHEVGGAQFQLGYDPAVLEFLSVRPGAAYDPASPFTQTVAKNINVADGRVFFAVATGIGQPGTHGPAVIATLRFRSLGQCTSTTVCYLDENPYLTILSDVTGSSIEFIPCCPSPLRLRDDNLELKCPSSVAVDAPANSFTADLSWTPPATDDNCNEPVVLSCEGLDADGLPVPHLVSRGGEFAVGRYLFHCKAESSCGGIQECSWTAEVRDRNAVEVDVQLSRPFVNQSVSRCIEFTLFDDCSTEPLVLRESLSFGPPYDFAGIRRGHVLHVPIARYACMTARDPLHTLAAASPLMVAGDRFMADFTGDPRLGGNWLWNGNLNGDGIIDIVDMMILSNNANRLVSPSTACDQPAPHADFTGDGLVDAVDLSVLQEHFLQQAGTCCPSPLTEKPAPVTSLTLKQIRAAGLGDWAGRDLNADGRIDRSEVEQSFFAPRQLSGLKSRSSAAGR